MFLKIIMFYLNFLKFLIKRFYLNLKTVETLKLDFRECLELLVDKKSIFLRFSEAGMEEGREGMARTPDN